MKGDFRLLMKSLLPNSTQQLRQWSGREMKKTDGRRGAGGEMTVEWMELLLDPNTRPRNL